MSQDKIAYFNKLATLDKSSDEDEIDTNDIRRLFPKRTESAHTATFSKPIKQKERSSAPSKPTPMLPQVALLPLPSALPTYTNSSFPKALLPGPREDTAKSVSDLSFVADTPPLHPARARSDLSSERRTVSGPIPSANPLILKSSDGVRLLLGRKRQNGMAETPIANKKSRTTTAKSIKLVPLPKQVFRSCTFLYIPDSDKKVLPEKRVAIAKEYGAQWTKDLRNATHVVVVKAYTHEETMKYLGVQTLPEGIIMVRDHYIPDCVRLGMLLNHTQAMYRVGLQSTKKPEEINLGILPSGKHLEQKQTSHPQDTQSVAASQSPISDQVLQNSLTQRSESTNTHSLVPHESNIDSNKRLWGEALANEMIRARALAGVTLEDEDEDEESEDTHSESINEHEMSGSEDETSNHYSKRVNIVRKGKGDRLAPENMKCYTGGTGGDTEANPNKRTIELLEEMGSHYTLMKDQWRELAYRRAVGELRKQTTRIVSYEDAVALPFVGTRLAAKIEEIALTNKLRRLDNANVEPNSRTLQLFMNIYGVAISQGWKWVLQGYKTLEDVKTRAHLTKNQKIGLDHYDDFLQRIPRSEVTALGDIVRTTMASIDPEIEIIIGGSYRRGAATSGDVDILLTKPNTCSSLDLLPPLNDMVQKLTADGFLVAALAVPDKTGSKWHGACVLPGSTQPVWRRIDFLVVPATELGAALIYFTGDDIFNRSIRFLAGKKGWRLNQRGLYKDVIRGQRRTKINEGVLMEGADEKEIFRLLGVPWRPPRERICH